MTNEQLAILLTVYREALDTIRDDIIDSLAKYDIPRHTTNKRGKWIELIDRLICLDALDDFITSLDIQSTILRDK